MTERRVLVDEVSRRWLCGELAASEYFAAANAAALEAARHGVLERLNGTHPGRRLWIRLFSRLVGRDAVGYGQSPPDPESPPPG